MPDLSLLKEVEALEITTEAKPLAEDLLYAREVINTCEVVRDLFIQARTKEWGAERLADDFMLHLDLGDRDRAWQAALYLADEYLQIGDKPLLIHRDTGKAVWALSEEDIWQPPPVERPGEQLVARPPMVNPVLLSGLLQVISDREREKAIIQAWQNRLVQTQFQKEEGDPRLDILTAQGRAAIVAQVRETMGFPGPSCCGMMNDFMDHFQEGVPPLPGWSHYSLELEGFYTLRIPDVRAVNLNYSLRVACQIALNNAWVVSLVRQIMGLLPLPEGPLSALEKAREGTDFVVGPRVSNPNWVLDTSVVLGLKPGIAGILQLKRDTIQVHHLEVSDRLDIRATCTCDVWLDPSRLVVFKLDSLPPVESELIH